MENETLNNNNWITAYQDRSQQRFFLPKKKNGANKHPDSSTSSVADENISQKKQYSI
jgi:hypothetical protein